MGFALFDTDFGPCGVAWNDDAVVAVALPEDDPDDMRDYLAGFGGDESPPTPLADTAIDGIRTLLHGGDPDFDGIPLATEHLPEFDRAVYDVTRSIPRGRTMTYGDVATRLGSPGAAQAVGRALGRNPIPVIIPCHRILGAGTEVGGFSAPGGAHTKQRILAIEGVSGFGEPTLF